MNFKNNIRSNKLGISIFVFLILILIVHKVKPGIIYEPSGAFREFGVGYKNKTVIPIWLLSIVLAIFSYLGILFYLYIV